MTFCRNRWFFFGSDQSFTINAGIQARFRLSQRFDLNLEYGGIILDDDLVTRGGFPNDGISNLSVGVTFRFKNRSFKKAVSQKQDADLQNLAKAQDARIKELISRTPDTVVKVVKQEVPTTETHVVFKALPTTINFAFNSYKIDPTQEVGVYNLVQFMKENPAVRVRLTGFADKRGTEKANICLLYTSFLCRLKVYNEDGAIFKTFNLKVPYPYEDGIVVLSLHDGKSMVSFKNVEGGDRVFEKGVYRLNNPGGTLGNAPRSILYNAKSNYIYIATEEPLKIAKVEANSMEILNMINCPEPRVERLLPNGESTITFLGGGRIADMNCQGEDFLNNFQQGITNAMMGGMFPDAYLANQAIISYSYSGTSYLVFDTRDKLFLAPGDWGMVMPVYDELEAVSVLGMLNSKNDGEGLIIRCV